MFCSKCGNQLNENSRYCAHCGIKKKKGYFKWIFSILALSLLLGAGIVYYFFNELAMIKPVDAMRKVSIVHNTKAEPEVQPTIQKQVLDKNQQRALTDIIATAQKTVYTVFTSESQGSGFLYNKNGAVVTNAHVVEGETDVSIKTSDGKEYPGTVIGYSNEIDVAVIHVPKLVGKTPFNIEKSGSNKIGEEVVALGSPLGLENTATMGYITGTDRSFNLGSYTYQNLYQISAPIAPGSSGGPLISKKQKK